MNTIAVYENYTIVANVTADSYVEKKEAQMSHRLLAGSRDHGYHVEYIGYGTINGKAVKAVYLFEEEEYVNVLEDNGGDEGGLDWDGALKRFELIEE